MKFKFLKIKAMNNNFKIFFRWIYNLAKVAVIAGLILLLNGITAGSAFLLTIGIGILCIITFISIFTPVKSEPVWTNVFPELLGDKELNNIISEKKKIMIEISALKSEIESLKK